MQPSLIKQKGVLSINGITASQILGLLETKHIKDVFIAECKNGETWGARDLLKLDAWVLQRTYSPLTTIGYEIKCSRADFENDQKWVGYLDLCHLFYFVCPAGLIHSTDIPSNIGLIWVSKSGRLHTKTKATRATPDIQKQNGLLIYALMSRSKIVANMMDINYANEPPDKLQEYRDIIERANERKELAYFIKAHIKKFAEEVHKKDTEFSNREYEIKNFEERLAKLGIVWDSKNSDWMDRTRVANEIDILGKQIDDTTLRNIETAGNQLTNLAAVIKKYRKLNYTSDIVLPNGEGE